MTKLMNQKKLKMIIFIIDIPRFGNDYIVDSLIKRYQTTKFENDRTIKTCLD